MSLHFPAGDRQISLRLFGVTRASYIMRRLHGNQIGPAIGRLHPNTSPTPSALLMLDGGDAVKVPLQLKILPDEQDTRLFQDRRNIPEEQESVQMDNWRNSGEPPPQ